MENEEPILILYVEDDPAHAEFTIRNFRKNNIPNTIVHVSDGEEALNYLFHRGDYTLQNSTLPDLILLDLRLPKVDGLEVLKIIKEDELLRCIPIIILTTSEADRDRAKAYQSHVNSYLVKPLDIEKFSSMIQSLGLYWVSWNQYPEIEMKDKLNQYR